MKNNKKSILDFENYKLGSKMSMIFGGANDGGPSEGEKKKKPKPKEPPKVIILLPGS